VPVVVVVVAPVKNLTLVAAFKALVPPPIFTKLLASSVEAVSIVAPG
jgi:hypothetical protein